LSRFFRKKGTRISGNRAEKGVYSRERDKKCSFFEQHKRWFGSRGQFLKDVHFLNIIELLVVDYGIIWM